MSKLLPIILAAAALIGFASNATAQDSRERTRTFGQEPPRSGEYVTQPADPSSPRVKMRTPEVPAYTWEERRAFERATGEELH
jgi:hypothetical protein